MTERLGPLPRKERLEPMIAKVLNFFKDPHGKRIRELKTQYEELDELANVAVQMGNAMAYKSLQTEMREVFFDYLTAIVVDALYRLVPHVLILWIISLYIPTITIPFVGWQVNIFAAYFLAYFTYYIGGWIIRAIKEKCKTKVKDVCIGSGR